MPKKALVINFGGAGNAVMTLPLLSVLGREHGHGGLFHMENDILSDSRFRELAGLSVPVRLLPTIWRRLRPVDQEAILGLIASEGISLVVNLRNEGPVFDRDYFEFVRLCSRRDLGLEFWHLDFDAIPRGKRSRNVAVQLRELLASRGLSVEDTRLDWASDCFPSRENETPIVSAFLGASARDKRWPVANWSEFLSAVLVQGGCDIEVHSGLGEQEEEEARSLRSSISLVSGAEKASFFFRESLWDLAARIAASDVLVTNDTVALHLAVAVGTPYVGLYLATDPDVWGYPRSQGINLRSPTLFKCEHWKVIAGNCVHFYDGCPVLADAERTIGAGEALAAITRQLDERRQDG